MAGRTLQEGTRIIEKIGAPDNFIHAVVCHGYGICVDVKPEREMEKVLYAADELTGVEE